jgi:uncharacterized protein (TIGR02265 family)
VQRFETHLDRPLDFDIDLERSIRETPPELTQKGMFFASVLARLGPGELEALLPRLKAPPTLGGYIAFLSYPMSDYFVLFSALMAKRPEGMTLAEAARRHGRESAGAFFDSHLGSTLVKMSSGPDQLLEWLPKAMETLFTGITLTAQRMGERHMRLTLANNRYGFCESVFVGSFEGWVVPFGHAPQMRVELHSPYDAVYEVRW